MIEIRMEVRGLAQVEAMLRQFEKRLSDWPPVLTRIGQILERDLKTSMARGMSYNGTKLAPVERWTRVVGLTTGRKWTGAITPLVATGQMRASMGPVRITQKGMEFGFTGKQYAKAEAMIRGMPGLMRIKEKGIKGLYTGVRTTKPAERKTGKNFVGLGTTHEYMAVRKDRGWRGYKLLNGPVIPIRPKPRDFFGVSRAALKSIGEYVDKWISAALK